VFPGIATVDSAIAAAQFIKYCSGIAAFGEGRGPQLGADCAVENPLSARVA